MSIHNSGAMLPLTVAGRFKLFFLTVGIGAPAVSPPRLGTDSFCTPPPSTEEEPPSAEGNLNQLRWCRAPTHSRRALRALLGSRQWCVRRHVPTQNPPRRRSSLLCRLLPRTLLLATAQLHRKLTLRIRGASPVGSALNHLTRRARPKTATPPPSTEEPSSADGD